MSDLTVFFFSREKRPDRAGGEEGDQTAAKQKGTELCLMLSLKQVYQPSFEKQELSDFPFI